MARWGAGTSGAYGPNQQINKSTSQQILSGEISSNSRFAVSGSEAATTSGRSEATSIAVMAAAWLPSTERARPRSRDRPTGRGSDRGAHTRRRRAIGGREELAAERAEEHFDHGARRPSSTPGPRSSSRRRGRSSATPAVQEQRRPSARARRPKRSASVPATTSPTRPSTPTARYRAASLPGRQPWCPADTWDERTRRDRHEATGNNAAQSASMRRGYRKQSRSGRSARRGRRRAALRAAPRSAASRHAAAQPRDQSSGATPTSRARASRTAARSRGRRRARRCRSRRRRRRRERRCPSRGRARELLGEHHDREHLLGGDEHAREELDARNSRHRRERGQERAQREARMVTTSRTPARAIGEKREHERGQHAQADARHQLPI